MKVLQKALFIMATGTILVACKKYEENTSILVRDCTATYLRIDNLDLPVMNPDVLSTLDSGETVNARYYFPKTEKVKINYGDDCGVPHTFPRGEWIFVEELK